MCSTSFKFLFGNPFIVLIILFPINGVRKCGFGGDRESPWEFLKSILQLPVVSSWCSNSSRFLCAL